MANPSHEERYRTALARVMRQLIDEGKPIEAGWCLFRSIILGLPDGTTMSETDQANRREAFFAGAEHMFSTLTRILDEAEEDGSAEDYLRIDKVRKELDEFDQQLRLKYGSAVGSA